MVGKLPAFALALTVAAVALPAPVLADGAWIDTSPPAQWNTPPLSLPAAPPAREEADPRCAQEERPAETDADRALASAGWKLFNPYEAGWGVSLVYGLTGHDGMCRPLGYQVFVFVEGQFAGTLSPAPMDSRTDGALENIVWTASADGTVELSALFNRYSEGDPLCCPSRTSFVHYRIDRSGQTPVVVPVSSTTLATGPSAPTPTPSATPTSTGTAGPG